MAVVHWDAPCEAPLGAFLIAFGLVGLIGALLYFVLEVAMPDAAGSGGEQRRSFARTEQVKLLVLLLLLAAAASGTWGTAQFALSPSCGATAPVLYKWSFAAALAFCIFVSLVLLVPILATLMPLAAMALAPLIGALAACASWMHEAGRRGAFGSVSALQRALSLGADEGEQPLIAPSSNFALYVNTTALCWFGLYFLLEARRAWSTPCDAPLGFFVTATAVGFLAFALIDFLRDVFKDPMPPMTKLEQSRARSDRRRRLIVYAWVLGGVLVWGALGLTWVRQSTSCAHTAPQLYRLALLICTAYVVLCGLLLLVLLLLAVDFCLSGRLRMVIVFER